MSGIIVCPKDKCGRGFFSEATLAEHIERVHTNAEKNGAATLLCQYCPREFSNKSNLNKHIANSHKISKRRRSKDISSDEKMKTALEFNAQLCSHCPASFGSAKALSKHSKEQHRQWPSNLCLECGYQCKSAKALRVHRADKHGESSKKKSVVVDVKKFADETDYSDDAVVDELQGRARGRPDDEPSFGIGDLFDEQRRMLPQTRTVSAAAVASAAIAAGGVSGDGTAMSEVSEAAPAAAAAGAGAAAGAAVRGKPDNSRNTTASEDTSVVSFADDVQMDGESPFSMTSLLMDAQDASEHKMDRVTESSSSSSSTSASTPSPSSSSSQILRGRMNLRTLDSESLDVGGRSGNRRRRGAAPELSCDESSLKASADAERENRARIENLQDYQRLSAHDESQLHVKVLASRVPYEPVQFENVPVPSYFRLAEHSRAATLFMAPSFLISYYQESSAVHVRDLLASPLHAERWLTPRVGAIIEAQLIGGWFVALLDDYHLMLYDAHRSTPSWTVELDCSRVFDRARKSKQPLAARTTALMLTDACAVVAANGCLCVWNWRQLLCDQGRTTAPQPVSSFPLNPIDAALALRSDFCAIDRRGHVLLGGNTSFVLYDIASELPIYRFVGGRGKAASDVSFHAMKWSGECVVTMEGVGLRVWRVLPLSRTALGGGTASESGALVREATVVTTLPLLIAPESDSKFVALHVDSDTALIGDSIGRVRVVPLAIKDGNSNNNGNNNNNNDSDSSATRFSSESQAASDATESDARKIPTGDEPRLLFQDESESERIESASQHDPSSANSSLGLTTLRQRELGSKLLVPLIAEIERNGLMPLKAAVRQHGSDFWRLCTNTGQNIVHLVATHGLHEIVPYIVKKAPPTAIGCVDENGWTALHTAASFGHAKTCLELLTRTNLSVFATSVRKKMTPLHFIARMMWRDEVMPALLVQVLKKVNRKLDVHNANLETPLHQACLLGYPQLVNWLLDNGAHVDAAKDSGETPLHIAARRGSLAIVRVLLRYGANPQIKSEDGRTPRDLADGLCAEALARALFDVAVATTANDIERGRVLKREASGGHSGDGLNASNSSNNSNSNDANGVTDSDNSTSAGNNGASANGANSGSGSGTNIVSNSSKASVVARLWRRKTEFKSSEKQEMVVNLGKSARAADMERLLELIKKNTLQTLNARDRYGQSLLHTAAFAGHLNIMQAIVSSKRFSVDMVRLRDKNGWTPLHSATSGGHVQVAELLLRHGANPYTPTATARGGTTALHYLARLPWSTDVEALWAAAFQRSKEPDVRDASGYTPLFAAANKNEPHTVLFLLAEGADVNARAKDGSTALHQAVSAHAIAAMQKLLAAGAQSLRAERMGKPKDLAAKLGFNEVCAVLDNAKRQPARRTSPRRRRRVKATRAPPPVYINAPAAEASRVNHVARDGNRVFCAQENGRLSAWSLGDRDSMKPLASVECNGPVRSLFAQGGVIAALAPLVGQKGAALPLGGGLDAQRALVQVTTAQWGVDHAVAMLDNKGRPTTIASRALTSNEIALWLKLDVDASGKLGNFVEKHLLAPWCTKAVTASLKTHGVHLQTFVGVRESHLQRAVQQSPHLAKCERSKPTTLADVSATLGRMRDRTLPLDPRTLRGANDGLHGGGAGDVALPLFFTMNRGGGYLSLYTLWSSGQRLPAPVAVLRAVLAYSQFRLTNEIGPGSGAGKLRGPAVRQVYGDQAVLISPPPLPIEQERALDESTEGTAWLSRALKQSSHVLPRNARRASTKSQSLATTASVEGSIVTSSSSDKDADADDKDGDKCTLCLEEIRGLVFIPCGHLVCCVICGEDLAMCPACQAHVSQKIAVKR